MIGGFKITLLSLWHFETPDKFCTCTPCQVFTRGNTKNKRVYNTIGTILKQEIAIQYNF